MSTPLRNARAVLTASAALLAGGALVAAPAYAAATTTSITTVAGTGASGFSGNGVAAVTAKLNHPGGVAEDLAGNLYVADTNNNRIREVVLPTTDHQDLINTLAGKATAGFTGDGGKATKAELDHPTGVAVDSQGDVFIADSGNNRIREIDASTGVITTVAGDGACGTDVTLGNQGLATQASLCDPTGVAVDGAGNIYIADSGHNLVRVVNASTGDITNFAGDGDEGATGNGGKPKKAELDDPTGVAVDAIGNIFIADSGNNEIRVVNSAGTEISDFAGTGATGKTGNGGQAVNAELSDPTGLGIDPSGDVFINDTGNNEIREVTPDGTISLYAGTGKNGKSGNGGAATASKLSAPSGSIAADGSAVYFADTGNARVQGVFLGPPPILPESPLVIALPISAVVLAGAGFVVIRRRRRSHAAA